MKNSLSILALIFFLTLSFQSEGQYRQKSSPLDRFYFGGGGGFSGGTDYLNVSVSPLAGYKITESFSAGITTTYQFVKVGNINFSNFGGGPFLRYNITEKFFAYSEYEYLNYEFQLVGGETDRDSFNSLFVGIGYTEPIGGNFSFNISALYNLLYGDGTDSPYQSPLSFRVGFIAGLF